ncbi:MAG: IS200/IS605 family transposase [Balneolales bacterium]|nr:IS200/IS605 family transposase [Balneolales bacterium]
MAKNLSVIWIHVVWSTRDRKRLLLKSFRFKVFKHIKEYASRNGIQLDIINGVEDHVHCLVRLKTTQTVSEVIQKIKGESSHWINENSLLDEPFNWQEGYGAFSVSDLEVMKIRKYIYNQEKYHKSFSYKDEIQKLASDHPAQD